MTERRRGQTGQEEPEGLLSDRDLDQIERDHPGGFTSAQVVDLFTSRGVKLSEATFRKYVQLGLVPRSRRVGRKGKHTGSMGLYPPATVRRINAIKQMMADSYTIEEIQTSFLRFRDEIESVKGGLHQLLGGFERQLKAAPGDATRRRALSKEIEEVRRISDELLGRIDGLERQIVQPLERAARARAFSAGAGKGAGDLL
jgi:hypothetical protein